MIKFNLDKIVEDAYASNIQIIENQDINSLIKDVAYCSANRGIVRILLACLIAKYSNSSYNACEPYTKISSGTSFSGRDIDQDIVKDLYHKYGLPINKTTGFLSPAWRNHSKRLSSDSPPEGRPIEVYKKAIKILELVESGEVDAYSVLIETIKQLKLLKMENEHKLSEAVDKIKNLEESNIIELSSEDIVNIIEQHIQSKGASRLPVIAIAAIYNTMKDILGEEILPLNSHNAADSQTGSLGDVEVTLIGSSKIVTAYEMKHKKVTQEDIDLAVEKISSAKSKIDNYIFITTKEIDKDVSDYSKSMYDKTKGVEFVILDCIGFLRYFLHLFHRHRGQFLARYEDLLNSEADSAINPVLKQMFFVLKGQALLALAQEVESIS
ncbi:DNA methyltransferase [Deinococcus ficus]|nr:DNA methyltransferase [Deinococcus ficus]